ncbi:XRE family transcriptional regulator [Caulobacter sp. 17J65-9]|uniref:helix-turn-helix domain-containing protein n=1 Tax=Caulobacter sp. 17J65-9 TaxID=2709382 RepID=UPI0013CDC797|nr:XRE family transcriptional regulator [Caulobacter sp. 17J65-9]NEX93232.1 helix-turn-helix domain-containing protein [Caulobacter sp. 17J65-9]
MDVHQLRDHLILSGGEVLTRPDPAPQQTVFDQGAFGTAIRRLRGERGWTLRELSQRSNISQSTLSRVETGQITLSFDRAHALAQALEADFTQFLKQMGNAQAGAEPGATRAHGWRAVTRAGEGHQVTQGNADYEYLCGDYFFRKMVTGVAVIRARSLDEHGPFVNHPGEEFIYVLEGAAVLATDIYAPLRLEAGDSLQFDAMTPHALYSGSDQPARVLFSITDPRWSQG